jgi:hypothetical protein
MHEFLPHDETIALMRSADLLFLPLYDLPLGRRAGIVPHKTYEYIGSRRPILAAVPDGDARDLLAGSGAAVLCRPTDTGAMADLLLADVDCWASGLPPRSPREAVVTECSAQRVVTNLAAAYDELLGNARGPLERARGDAAPSVLRSPITPAAYLAERVAAARESPPGSRSYRGATSLRSLEDARPSGSNVPPDPAPHGP